MKNKIIKFEKRERNIKKNNKEKNYESIYTLDKKMKPFEVE